MRISDWSSDVCSSELAGIGQAEGGERRREIQLDAPGLSVTDIPRRVEIAVAQILDHDMFDEVGDVAVEEVDAENAPAAQAALIADVDAPSLFVAEFRITAGAILVARRLIFFDGGDENVSWTAHSPGEVYTELVFVRWRIAEVA